MPGLDAKQTVDPDVLQRSLVRERRARKEAESLLEAKSRELYQKNEELEASVAAETRTAKLSSTILENAAEGIITFDEQCLVETANPAACRIFGFSAKELIGSDVRKLMKIDASLPEQPVARFSTVRSTDQ